MNIMLRTIAALLFVANFVAVNSSPELGFSRIVTQKSGSVTLKLKHKPGSARDFMVDRSKGKWYYVDIKDGKCFKKSEVWSSPCNIDEKTGTAVITVKDVTALNDICMQVLDYQNEVAYISIIFAPDCNFWKPLPGYAITKESIPLSKFVKGQSRVLLTFAVDGLTSEVYLSKNWKEKCRWKGVKLISGWDCARDDETDTDLEVDEVKNMRIFKKTFPVPFNPDGIDTYEWWTDVFSVSITVDKNQAGESPEMEGCPGFYSI